MFVPLLGSGENFSWIFLLKIGDLTEVHISLPLKKGTFFTLIHNFLFNFRPVNFLVSYVNPSRILFLSSVQIQVEVVIPEELQWLGCIFFGICGPAYCSSSWMVLLHDTHKLIPQLCSWYVDLPENLDCWLKSFFVFNVFFWLLFQLHCFGLHWFPKLTTMALCFFMSVLSYLFPSLIAIFGIWQRLDWKPSNLVMTFIFKQFFVPKFKEVIAAAVEKELGFIFW